MRKREEQRRRVNIMIALILSAFALVTYLMTFVIAQLTK